MANKTINELPIGTAVNDDTNFAVQQIDGTTENITGLVLKNYIGGGVIEGTYDELTILKSNNELIPGAFYKITDFQTIYDQPDYDDADNEKAVVVTKTAPIDPILLLATSPNTFAKEVWRPSTPQHSLEYDFDFIVTEVMGASAKGRITKCIDELNNETQYDHSVVLFKRYESVSGSGIYNSFWDTGFDSVEVHTFGNNSFGNKIGLTGKSDFILNNNTFGDNTYSNTFGNGTNNNTFGNDINNNIFGDGTYYNTFGNDTSSNIFGDGTNNNTFGNGTYNNTFGNGAYNNTFGNDTSSNIFGDGTYYNTFGDNTYSNTFGNGTNNNTFGNDINNNIFGDGTYYNTFGNNTSSNIFGNDINNIDFTSATHIIQPYLCEIFKRQDSTYRLRYTDNSDALVVVAPTA